MNINNADLKSRAVGATEGGGVRLTAAPFAQNSARGQHCG